MIAMTMTTFEAQGGLLATLEGPKISYINVDIDSDPLIIKSMLLAAATAMFAGDTDSNHPTPISIGREIPLRK